MFPTPSVTHEKLSVKRQAWADASLALMTLVWGSTFVLVKDITEQVSPMLFLAVRFMLGALAIALFMAFTGRWRGLTVRELRWGALIGVALWAGYALQTLGLRGTTASNAGFITGLSVVIVPLLGVFVLRQKPGPWAWAGVALATVGLAMLSFGSGSGGAKGLSFLGGDGLVLGCAFAFAVQIVLIAKVAGWCNPWHLTIVQVTVAGLLNAVSALIFERPVTGLSGEVWAGAAFLGIVASGLAIVLQTGVQRYTTVVHTALIFSLEPVFALAFGYWLQGDRLSAVALWGAGLILAGMLLAELGSHLGLLAPRQFKRRAAARHARSLQTRTELPTQDVS